MATSDSNNYAKQSNVSSQTQNSFFVPRKRNILVMFATPGVFCQVALFRDFGPQGSLECRESRSSIDRSAQTIPFKRKMLNSPKMILALADELNEYRRLCATGSKKPAIPIPNAPTPWSDVSQKHLMHVVLTQPCVEKRSHFTCLETKLENLHISNIQTASSNSSHT
jgi:hypothetical protein